MKRELIDLVERGWVPDAVVRIGIRHLLRCRLRDVQDRAGGDADAARRRFMEMLRSGPVAAATDRANEQHYEVPTAFFEHVLGPRMKYSSCLWPAGVTALGAAEDAMLKTTCERAALADGQRVLELGCGWGALTLWMAETYPGSRITVVSNSVTQRQFIEARAAAAGLTNMDAARKAVMPILHETYGADAPRWFVRWRLFFMACEELFAFDGGREWFVGHFRYAHRGT